MSITFLNVPFPQKDRAKALGARWNGEEKKWYVPENLDKAVFAEWLSPEQIQEASDLPIRIRKPVQEEGAQTQDLLSSTASSHIHTDATVFTGHTGISLAQLLSGVTQVVSAKFREGVWTRLEVVKASNSKGSWYLEVSERDLSGNVIATAKAIIWPDVAKRIIPEFEKDTGATIGPGIKLLVRIKPDFSPKYGLSLVLDALDSSFTLGDLEAKKREIRAKLIAEGCFNKNQLLQPPWDFNSVLVISPESAAGLGDFQADANKLSQFGICDFIYKSATFQGIDAPRQIRQAMLDYLADCKKNALTRPDVIVIIRGGGAVNDLAWLNDYELAKAICEVNIPVFAGVGHERDSTMVDEVAHQKFDTPSKVIKFIESIILQRTQEARGLYQQIGIDSQKSLQIAKDQSVMRYQRIKESAGKNLVQSKERVEAILNSIKFVSFQTNQKAAEYCSGMIYRVRDLAKQNILEAQVSLPLLMDRVKSQSYLQISSVKQTTQQNFRLTLNRIDNALVSNRKSIDEKMKLIPHFSYAWIERSRKNSEALFREIIGQSPDRTLKRGFTIVRTRNQEAVLSVKQLKAEQEITIQFSDGMADANIHKISEK